MREARHTKPFLRIGGIVVLAMLIPLGLGLWLDKRLGSAPLFTLAGAIVGILVATIGIVRIAGRAIAALGTPPVTEAGLTEKQGEDKEDTAQ